MDIWLEFGTGTIGDGVESVAKYREKFTVVCSPAGVEAFAI